MARCHCFRSLKEKSCGTVVFCAHLWVCLCASLLVDAVECLSCMCYDLIDCLLVTSSLGFVVVHGCYFRYCF